MNKYKELHADLLGCFPLYKKKYPQADIDLTIISKLSEGKSVVKVAMMTNYSESTVYRIKHRVEVRINTIKRELSEEIYQRYDKESCFNFCNFVNWHNKRIIETSYRLLACLIDTYIKTNEGYKIAAADIAQRDVGDLIGLINHNDEKYMYMIRKYPEWYDEIKKIALRMIENEQMDTFIQERESTLSYL